MKLKNNLVFEKVADLIIKAWIAYFFFVFASTEILSIFNSIDRKSIIIIYVFLGLLMFLFVLRKKVAIDFKFLKKTKNTDKLILLALLLTVLLPILFTALYYPPNNWDSMTYHMARIMHWVENENVNFYFTQNDRQLFSGPLAEYVILHWYLLADSDIFSNLVQYFSLIVATCASYLIAKFLSKDKKINLLSIVLILTTPMAIMQASSTQNDLAVSSILLSTIYLGFKKSWLFFGLSIGLGMLTKNTYAIFALPFCIYFGIMWLKEYKQRSLLLFLWFLLCVVLTNVTHWRRNYLEFGSPVGPEHMSKLILNEDHQIKFVISNMVKNAGLQIGFPNDRINFLSDRVIYGLHKKANVDIVDPRNTYSSIKYGTYFAIHEDLAGNLILSSIIFVSLLFIFIEKKLSFYWLNILGGWFLFNFLLKWQPWGSRLLLPWIMASIPFASIIMTKKIKNKKAMLIIVCALIAASWPFVSGSSKYFGNFTVFLSSNRQILPIPNFRETNNFEKYFYGKKDSYADTTPILDIVSENNIKEVGLDLGYDSWEYTWWVMLRKIQPMIKINVYKIGNYENQSIISDDENCKIKFPQMELKYYSPNICFFLKKQL